MNQNTKNTMLGIVLFILGASLGGIVSMKFFSPFNSWTTWMWTGNGIGAYAEVQYHKAQYNQAVKAQTEYLSYLAGIEKKKSEWNTWSVPWMTEQILEYERTVTYARIAMLEEREGKSAEASTYWGSAEKTANAAGWKNSSREHIQQIVKSKDVNFEKMMGNAEPRIGARKQQIP